MIYVSLPADGVHQLSFYLAMEEYIARKLQPSDYFFMWQVEPSVIFGRNQLIENEVNLDFCRSHGIRMYRRKSGGGCVYADMKNIMFSYITADDQVGFTFNRYISMVVLMLQRLGVDASGTGRNDVMIGNRKVSGTAFYKIPGRSIVHGTMLYDTDMFNMVGSITPSSTKLLSKGVVSVHQHIALLKDYINLTIDEFKAHVRKTLCDDELILTREDVENIQEMEKDYLSDDFIYGKNPQYTIVKKHRIEGVGDFEARIALKNGIIQCVNLMGDFLLVGDLDHGLLDKMKGVPLTKSSLRSRLPDRIDDIVMNLMTEDFVRLLTE